MIVLGIDPGYAIVGCGVVEYKSNHFRLLTYGAITTEAHTPFNERIEKIFDEANELIQRFRPDAMAITDRIKKEDPPAAFCTNGAKAPTHSI